MRKENRTSASQKGGTEKTTDPGKITEPQTATPKTRGRVTGGKKRGWDPDHQAPQKKEVPLSGFKGKNPDLPPLFLVRKNARPPLTPNKRLQTVNLSPRLCGRACGTRGGRSTSTFVYKLYARGKNTSTENSITLGKKKKKKVGPATAQKRNREQKKAGAQEPKHDPQKSLGGGEREQNATAPTFSAKGAHVRQGKAKKKTGGPGGRSRSPPFSKKSTDKGVRSLKKTEQGKTEKTGGGGGRGEGRGLDVTTPCPSKKGGGRDREGTKLSGRFAEKKEVLPQLNVR